MLKNSDAMVVLTRMIGRYTRITKLTYVDTSEATSASHTIMLSNNKKEACLHAVSADTYMQMLETAGTRADQRKLDSMIRKTVSEEICLPTRTSIEEMIAQRKREVRISLRYETFKVKPLDNNDNGERIMVVFPLTYACSALLKTNKTVGF